MKQFIVLIAVLPILLLFLLQVTYDQKNSVRAGAVQALVYSAKEDAKQEGCFTEEIQQKLKQDLARVVGIQAEEIQIEADEMVKYRYSKGDNRLIYYKISVPLKDVMAGVRLFGISEEENRYTYVIDSYTASERL